MQASLVAQIVKNLPVTQETWFWSLGLEDALKKGMSTTPVFLPGEFHGQMSLAGYSLRGHKGLDKTEWLSMHTQAHQAQAFHESLALAILNFPEGGGTSTLEH